MLNRVTTPQNLDERFRDAVSALRPPESGRPAGDPVREGSTLTGDRAREIFDAQLAARHLDLAARWLRSFNEGFHTTGSAGHEGNAAVAAALRGDDPALLHHRSAAFYCVRSAQRPDDVGGDPVRRLEEAARDVLRGVVASVRDPITGGRDKLFGNAELHLLPAVSTPAAHLPRALGLARVLSRAGDTPWPQDAIVAASFGDAGATGPGAAATLHAAGWHERAGLSLPLLLICEDNGPGNADPEAWTAAALRGRPGLRYSFADGCDLASAYDAAVEAVDFVRRERRPALLHLSTVHLLGQAPDPEPGADLDRDPLVGTARLLVEAGLLGPDDVITRYDEVGWQVRKAAEEVLGEPKLASVGEIVASLAPRRPLRVAHAVAEASSRAAGPGGAARHRAFDGRLPELAGPMTLAQTINATLTDALAANPGLLVFGPATTRGGPHGVTTGLRELGGDDRVFDSLPDATTILGLALGAGTAGLLPVPELSGPADLHDAGEQLRGKRRRCRTCPPAPTATRWCCASRHWPSRSGWAGTSPTTTRSLPCATYPDWSWPCRPGRTTPRRCSAPAWPPRRWTARSVSSSSRSPSIRRGTSINKATASGWRRTRARKRGPAGTCRSAGRGSTAWAAPRT